MHCKYSDCREELDYVAAEHELDPEQMYDKAEEFIVTRNLSKEFLDFLIEKVEGAKEDEQ